MPADKYVFLTRADELALSNVLREKFPNIRFFTKEAHEQHFNYFTDIAAIEIINSFGEPNGVNMVVAPQDWEPEVAPYEFHLGRQTYRVTNYPEECMSLARSRIFAKVIQGGAFQVGFTRRMSERQISFANKVWRLLSKIGTYDLKWRNLERDWSADRHPGKHWFAGHDAVRWALEDDARYFDYSGFYRPFDPKAD